MIWLEFDGLSMMKVVLVGGVDPRVVRIWKLHFIAPVEIDTVAIEKQRKFEEHEVSVDRHDEGEEEKWACTDKLIQVFIGNHSKGTWVVEVMVSFVNRPEHVGRVSTPVIEEFKKIASNPNHKETKDLISNPVWGPTIRFGIASLSKIQRQSGTEGCGKKTLGHRSNFFSDHGWFGIFWVRFVAPVLIGGVLIVSNK